MHLRASLVALAAVLPLCGAPSVPPAAADTGTAATPATTATATTAAGEPDAGGPVEAAPGALEAWRVPELGQTLFFVRFADPREGRAELVVRDILGDEVVRLEALVADGAALVVWDGNDAEGSPVDAGTFVATLEGAVPAAGAPPSVAVALP